MVVVNFSKVIDTRIPPNRGPVSRRPHQICLGRTWLEKPRSCTCLVPSEGALKKLGWFLSVLKCHRRFFQVSHRVRFNQPKLFAALGNLIWRQDRDKKVCLLVFPRSIRDDLNIFIYYVGIHVAWCIYEYIWVDASTKFWMSRGPELNTKMALPASQTTKPDESKAISGDAVRFFFRLFSLTLWTKEQ